MVPSSRRTVLRLGALAVAGLAFPSLARAGAASPWDQGYKSRARLIAGGRSGEALLAGVEMELEPGFKTYWRNPGEAGLPPAFDWSGSANLKRAEVLWPGPSRYDDPGGVAYGYEGGVVLPVRIEPVEPGKPVTLRLALDYGVCKEICIPAKASLALRLPGGAAEAEPKLAAALARVPKPARIGGAGELAVESLAAVSGDKPALDVTVRAPAGARPDLFVEAPEGWFFSSEGSSDEGERRTFRVEALDRPPGSATPVGITLTVVAGDRAIEAKAELDETLRPR